MPTPSDALPDPDLSALQLLLAVHGRRVDLARLGDDLRRTGRRSSDALAAAQVIGVHGLKAVYRRTRWSRLPREPLPALVETREGRLMLLAKAGEADVLLHDAVRQRPVTMSRAEFEACWTGRLVGARPATKRRDTARRFGLSWFLPLLTKHRLVLGQAVTASLLMQFCALVLPLFTMIVMDKVVVNGALTTLEVMAVGALIMAGFEFMLSALRSHLLAYATHRLEVELSAHAFAHLLALPMSYFDARSTGATAARVKELDTIRGFLTGPALTTGVDLLFTTVHVAVIWCFAPSLALAVLAAVLVMLGVHVVVTPPLRRRLTGKLRGDGEEQSILVEAVTGIETIKAATLEGEFQRRWEEHVAERAEAAYGADRLSQGSNAVMLLINRVLGVGALCWGVVLVLDGGITLGQLVAFNMMSGRVLGPAQRLAQFYQQVEQARLAARRVAEVLDVPREPAQPTVNLPPMVGRVTFRNVTFRYRPERQPVLRGVDFEIGAGEVVGIVGTSGSGKSTLTRLIQRLYVPESGRVLIDDVDIAQVDPVWLRRQVALVPQDNFLFDRSVRENIALGHPELSFDRVVAAAKLAGAHDFIMELPDGYEASVGERGHLLSGGQRQRIALARAVAADPRILILDEATSALDSESERVVQAAMRRICAGRTVIMVAHRLSTLASADRVLVLEHGVVEEEGRPDELLARGGRFARLWEMQQATPATLDDGSARGWEGKGGVRVGSD